jgi:hypothetical protein
MTFVPFKPTLGKFTPTVFESRQLTVPKTPETALEPKTSIDTPISPSYSETLTEKTCKRCLITKPITKFKTDLKRVGDQTVSIRRPTCIQCYSDNKTVRNHPTAVQQTLIPVQQTPTPQITPFPSASTVNLQSEISKTNLKIDELRFQFFSQKTRTDSYETNTNLILGDIITKLDSLD